MVVVAWWLVMLILNQYRVEICGSVVLFTPLPFYLLCTQTYTVLLRKILKLFPFLVIVDLNLPGYARSVSR